MAWKWSAIKEEAALLMAQEGMSTNKIAETIKRTDRVLRYWRQVPEFAARIEEHQKAFRELIRSRGIALLDNRLTHLQNRHDKMQQIIRERGEAANMQAVPGGTTGLIVHNVKCVGKGEDYQLVDLYEVDTPLLREMRELEKQAAQELGQWTEKKEHSGTVRFNPITLDGDKEASDEG